MTTLSLRQGAGPFSVMTGAVHPFVLRRLLGHFIEVEDLHFNHDSAVLLADYRDTTATDDDAAEDAQDDAQDTRVTALAVLAAVFKHLEGHPERKVLVTGHTDKSGSDAYNLSLSQKRADNVMALLKGDKAAWVASCLDHTKVEDHQQLLKWMFEDHGWDCDPGAIDNQSGPATRGATERFKERYNTDFSQSIAVNGNFDRAAWEAFHDVYERELLLSMGWTQVDMDGVRLQLQLVDPGAVGCGENWPVTGQNKSRVDRRVEIMLFDPGEEPTTPLACHPAPNQCRKDDCELRKPLLYTLIPLPVTPVLAPKFRVIVHLRLFWKDPGGVERALPKDLPAHVEFGDGRPAIDVAIREEGLLFFIADKRSVSFTFGFRHEGTVQFLASAPTAAPEPERLVAEADVAPLLRQSWRAWRLPAAWSLTNCDWQIDATAAPTYAAPNFAALDTIDHIGTAEAPCTAELVPHWQYLKLTYFDRKLKQRLSLPPITLEGFLDKAQSSGAPDTQSNWLTDPEACQALPWLLRKKDDGTALAKPDAATLLRARTKPNTFVDASGATRKLVTKSPGADSADVGLNGGVDTPFDVARPSGGRLAFYDLPPLWLSRTYFCRLSGGTGAPAAQQGRYEDLAATATTDAAPLLFSLDDIVLCTGDASGTLTPLAWTPDAQPLNRVALFCNTFAAGPNLSVVGLYKPDTANSQAYFTQRPSVENTRNYIADYPDWVRLVITQGNAFDVFDRRVVLDPDGVVGARAGVRHVDATTSPNFVQHMGLHPTGELDPRPGPVDRPFMSVQPMYEQRHHQWWTGSRTADRGIGRYDMMLLRCSDVDADGTTEVTRCLSYWRFFFDYNATFESSSTPAPTPLALTGAAATAWGGTAIANLLRRWNGPDAAMNPGPAIIAPRAATPSPLRATTLWFAQELPAAVAHYQIGVFQAPFRAYMAADKGRGALDSTNNAAQGSGWFTFAHEVGHGASLHDEYVEPNTRTNVGLFNWLDSFDCFSPGSPFVRDDQTMMNQNKAVDARDHWHVAEWLRTRLGNTLELEVRHGTHVYHLPHHAQAPAKNHICWPLREDINRSVAGRSHSRFDAFLYPLGDDRWASTALPTRVGQAAPFDGILVIVVKLRFRMHTGFTTTTNVTGATVADAAGIAMHDFLVATRNQVRLRYCDRYYVRGSAGGRTFSRALLEFSPRYYVTNSGQDYGKEAPHDTNHHIEVKVEATGSPEWDSGLFSDDHELHYAYNQPAHVFATQFFSEMVGVTPATHTDAASFIPIIQGVLPGGTVHAF
jgi:OmpA family